VSELQTFFNMGGYAFYVWNSFLLTLLVLGFVVWLTRRQYRQEVLKTAARAASRNTDAKTGKKGRVES